MLSISAASSRDLSAFSRKRRPELKTHHTVNKGCGDNKGISTPPTAKNLYTIAKNFSVKEKKF
jgi:hypothetical protein